MQKPQKTRMNKNCYSPYICGTMKLLAYWYHFLLVPILCEAACQPPYHPVGDHCLLIDNVMRGSWQQMSAVCQAIGGHLVNLKDANILYDINRYIRDQGMADVNYWVGATDNRYEGHWTWSDGTELKRVSPVWGRLYGQQPEGWDEDQNCGAIEVRDFYYLHDDSCEDSLYGVICQSDSDNEEMVTGSLPSYECPPPYEKIGNACLRVHVENAYNWTDAKELCYGLHTHMAKFDDANLIGDLYEYLMDKGVNTSLWIGGNDNDIEGHWVWHDGSEVRLGTPFWNVLNEMLQEPGGGDLQNCMSMFYGKTYHFGDDPCNNTRGVVCQYDVGY